MSLVTMVKHSLQCPNSAALVSRTVDAIKYAVSVTGSQGLSQAACHYCSSSRDNGECCPSKVSPVEGTY